MTRFLQQKDSSGFVYLAYCLDSKMWKIGKSKNDPLKRISTIKTCNPSIKDYFYFKVEDMNIEFILHERYKEKRYVREWFRLTPDDIHNIMVEFNNDYAKMCQLWEN